LDGTLSASIHESWPAGNYVLSTVRIAGSGYFVAYHRSGTRNVFPTNETGTHGVDFSVADFSIPGAEPEPEPEPEPALIRTTTSGDVSDRSMEQYGGYTFKGKTKPSKRGQKVVFHYKRPNANKWRRFKVGLADGRNAFFLWKIWFTPGVKLGKWLLRAKFLRQDVYKASSVVRRVKVRASD
jgi:hypothetical protein